MTIGVLYSSCCVDTGRTTIKDRCESGIDPAPRLAPDAVLGLADWNKGTMVEEGVMGAGRSATLAPVGGTRAMLIVVCLDDCRALRLSTNGGPPCSQPVAPGSILLLDAQREHRVEADRDVRIVCFGVENRLLDQLIHRTPIAAVAVPTPIHGPDQAFHDAAVHGLATSARSVLGEPNLSRGLFLEQVTCAVAAHLLLRLDEARARLAGSGGLAPWQLSRVRRTVDANLGRALQAHELAEACGLSPSHFSRAFRCSTGASPHVWVTGRRVARAKDLMRTSHAQLAEIALECGFADQSHFTRVFTREAGVSPGAWRRNLNPDERGQPEPSRRSPARRLAAPASAAA